MTESTPLPLSNRWLVVIGAVLIQLCLGAIYAWSVFTPALTAKTPGEVAAVYQPAQLGLDQAKADELAEALRDPRAQMRDVAMQRKVARDPDRAAELDEKGAALSKQVDVIVVAHVPADRLAALTYGFENAPTQAIFSAGLLTFAVVMVLAGRLMPVWGPRRLAATGGVVLGAGYLLAGLVAGKSFALLFICIGIIGGAGIGMAYVVPIAVGMKWFPDRKGMITGLAVAGFGFGALLWVKLAGAWGQLIAGSGLPMTLMVFGVVFMVMCLIGSMWMVSPPEGWTPPGWTPRAAAGGSGAPAGGQVEFNWKQMLATPQFHLISTCFAFGAGAGLMSIGLMKAFPIQALTDSGIELAKASAIAGTAMAVFFSLANGVGRIAWGVISDHIGRRASLVLMLGTQGVIVIAFPYLAGQEWLLYLGATLIGFNFGGNFALFPTVTADTFGTKYLAQNYGWVFLAYGFGGILGPMLGGMLGDMGNFPLAFMICGVLCLIASAIAASVRHPHAEPTPTAQPATA